MFSSMASDSLSCSCTHCRDLSCSCTACCDASRALVPSLGSYNANYADNDSESDNDSDCPPPPPDSSANRDGVVRNLAARFRMRRAFLRLWNYSARKKDRRHRLADRRHRLADRRHRLAVQFYRNIMLLKHFFAWSELTKLQLQERREARPTLRRILLVWREETGADVAREEALAILCSIELKRQTKMLRQAVLRWKDCTMCLSILTRAFCAWRDDTRRRMQIRLSKESQAMLHLRRTRVESSFLRWRQHSMLCALQRNRDDKCRRQIFQCWRHQTVASLRIEVEREGRIRDRRTRQTLARVFDAVRIYAASMELRRCAASSIAHIVEQSVLRKALTSIWYRNCRGLVCVENAMQMLCQKRRHAQQYCALQTWKCQTQRLAKRERALVSMIFNRWKLLVEENMKRRSRNEMALRFWACKMCTKTLRGWKAAVETATRTSVAPFEVSLGHGPVRVCRTNHFLQRPYGSRQTEKPLSFYQNKNLNDANKVTLLPRRVQSLMNEQRVTAARGCLDQKTVQLPDNRRIEVGKQPRRIAPLVKASQQRSHPPVSSLTSPVDVAAARVLSHSQVSEAAGNVVRASPSFGVRIPSWIEEEMKRRKHNISCEVTSRESKFLREPDTRHSKVSAAKPLPSIIANDKIVAERGEKGITSSHVQSSRLTLSKPLQARLGVVIPPPQAPVDDADVPHVASSVVDDILRRRNDIGFSK